MGQTTETGPDVLMLFSSALESRLGPHLKQTILYGSRARGDAYPDSDYDILIVLKEVPPEIDDILDEIAGDFFYEYGLLFPVIAVSEKKYAEEEYNPLFMNIKKEGVSL